MLKEIFQRLNTEYPISENRRHGIFYREDTQTLILTVWVHGASLWFTFQEEELGDTDKVLADIKNTLEG